MPSSLDPRVHTADRHRAWLLAYGVPHESKRLAIDAWSWQWDHSGRNEAEEVARARRKAMLVAVLKAPYAHDLQSAMSELMWLKTKNSSIANDLLVASLIKSSADSAEVTS